MLLSLCLVKKHYKIICNFEKLLIFSVIYVILYLLKIRDLTLNIEREYIMNNYPNTVTYDGKKLIEIKESCLNNGGLMNALRKKSDDLLKMGRVSVIDRRLKAPSGDIHDYMSMGPYWWPDPSKPDGLPYIRKDGVINPETQDPNTIGKVADTAHNLALAAFYFGDMRYAKKAVKVIRDWYLEPESYMNPNLNYGQAIPGICDGRGIGLIDFSTCYNVYNAIAILQYLNAIDDDTVNSMKKWVNEFVDWMLTSEIGIDEDNQHNNHGVYFDVQVASAAIFTGRPMLAKKVLNHAYDLRVKKHIKDDGSQPHELARTKAMSYSFMNLEGLMLLGNMAIKQGVRQPYWSSDNNGDCLLKRAVDFLYPYVISPQDFPYQQIEKADFNGGMAKFLYRVDYYFPGEGYKERANELCKSSPLWKLYPLV